MSSITIYLGISSIDFSDFFDAVNFSYNRFGETSDTDKYLELNEWITDILINFFEEYTNSFLKEKESTYLVFHTPKGEKTLYQPGLSFFMHNHKNGFNESQDLIGINIFGKFFGAFLDWDIIIGNFPENGLFILGQRELDIINKIKHELVKINPIFNIFNIIWLSSNKHIEQLMFVIKPSAIRSKCNSCSCCHFTG